MRKFHLFMAINLIFAALWAGCSDKKTPAGPASVFTIDRFPVSIGNQWIYSVRDTILGTIDTIRVMVFDTTTLPNGELATVWFYSDTGYRVHVNFVSIVGDTVKFYRDRSARPGRIFVFPIEVGKGWRLSRASGRDTSSVTAKEWVSTPLANFTAYRINTELMPLPLDVFEGSSVWLAPYIGFVKMEYFQGFRVMEKFEVWELLDYLPARTSSY
jgi:hypothetical protein